MHGNVVHDWHGNVKACMSAQKLRNIAFIVKAMSHLILIAVALESCVSREQPLETKGNCPIYKEK